MNKNEKKGAVERRKDRNDCRYCGYGKLIKWEFIIYLLA